MYLFSVSTQATCQEQCTTNANTTILSSADANLPIQVHFTDPYHEKYLAYTQQIDRTQIWLDTDEHHID